MCSPKAYTRHLKRSQTGHEHDVECHDKFAKKQPNSTTCGLLDKLQGPLF